MNKEIEKWAKKYDFAYSNDGKKLINLAKDLIIQGRGVYIDIDIKYQGPTQITLIVSFLETAKYVGTHSLSTANVLTTVRKIDESLKYHLSQLKTRVYTPEENDRITIRHHIRSDDSTKVKVGLLVFIEKINQKSEIPKATRKLYLEMTIISMILQKLINPLEELLDVL